MPRVLESEELESQGLVPIGEAALATDLGADESASVLRARLETIRRHATKIMLFVAVCTLVAAIVVFRLPRRYDGVAVLRVDPTAQQNIVGQNQAQPSPDNTTLMATEQEEITSADVVIPVINELHLAQDSEFDVPGGAGFIVAGVSSHVLENVLKALSVTRPPDTFLLNIDFRARSPQLAAQAANAIADSMIRHEYETRSQSLRSSSQYLTAQVQDLRAEMEKSQQALTEYERAHSILSPDDKFNLLNQQLSAIASDLGQQEASDRKLQAELALAKAHSLDDILVSDRGESLRPLIEADQAEQLQFASIAAKYGTADATYKQEQRKLDGDQAAINSAMDHLALQIQAEADAQQIQTSLAEKAYNAKKLELENYNANAAQYALLKQQADTEASLYEDMLQRIQQADVTAGYHANTLRVVESALPDPRPTYPRIALMVGLAFLLSLIVAVIAAFVAGTLDRTLSDPASVLMGTGEPMLGSLPLEADADQLHSLWRSSESVVGGGTLSARPRHTSYAEAIFTLRTGLFLGTASNITSLAFTSSQPRDGKTTTAISLACASARNGVRTILVDADLRRPEIHRAMQLPNRHGTSSVLRGEVKLEDVVLAAELDNLTILPAGPAVGDSTELLSGRIGPLVEELRGRYKLVIVDCPPVLGFADSMIIGPTVDAVVMVARAASTPREYVRAAIEQLRRVRVNIAGVVLNGVSRQSSQYYRYYEHYSQYYRSSEVL